MNIMAWNYKGTTTRGFVNLIRDIKDHQVSMLCLMEIDVSGEKAQNIVGKCGLDRSFIFDSQGQVGGI